MSRNLIYSYWLSKPAPPGALAGSAAMKAYAERIGAGYRCDWHDPFTDRLGVPARFFDKLRPAFDPGFAQYERVLSVDHDVFPVDGLTENIFDLPVGDFGMCEEPDQPEMRERFPSSLFSTNGDEKWARFVFKKWLSAPPFDQQMRPRTWNAGLILFSQAGMEKLRAIRPTPREYVAATTAAGLPGGVLTEQGYLNTLAFLPDVKFTSLSVEWNRQLFHEGPQGQAGRPLYDRRTSATKFVHVQTRGADWNDANWHRDLVNGHLQRHGDQPR